MKVTSERSFDMICIYQLDLIQNQIHYCILCIFSFYNFISVKKHIITIADINDTPNNLSI